MNAFSTWTDVSSGDRFNARQYLDTTSTTAIAHQPGKPRKCVKSYTQTTPGTSSAQSGNGVRSRGAGRGRPGNRTPASVNTRNTDDSDTYTRSRRDPRWASLRCDRSTCSHSRAKATIASVSQSSKACNTSPTRGPAGASSRLRPPSRWARHANSRVWLIPSQPAA